MRPVSFPIAVALVLAAVLTGCNDPAPSPSQARTPSAAGAGLSDAEKKAVFDRAAAATEKNAKVTRRPRRFSGDSL